MRRPERPTVEVVLPFPLPERAAVPRTATPSASVKRHVVTPLTRLCGADLVADPHTRAALAAAQAAIAAEIHAILKDAASFSGEQVRDEAKTTGDVPGEGERLTPQQRTALRDGVELGRLRAALGRLVW